MIGVRLGWTLGINDMTYGLFDISSIGLIVVFLWIN